MKKTVTGTPPPKPGGGQRVFRWEILGIPLALGIGGWLLQSCAADNVWEHTMDGLPITDRTGYTHLVVLGLVLIGIVAVAKVIWGRGAGHGSGGRP